MTTAVKLFQVLALAALAVLLGEAAWTIHRIRPKLEVTISNADRTLIVAGAAATHLEKAAGTWQEASKSQALATTQTMSNVGAAAKQLSGFISKTDDSVNSVLLPALSNSITEQNAALLSTQRGLQENLFQMSQATAEAQKVMADADEVIADPQIKETLAHVNETSESVAGVAQDTKESADMLEARLRQMLKPSSIGKQILLTALDWGFKVRGLLGF